MAKKKEAPPVYVNAVVPHETNGEALRLRFGAKQIYRFESSSGKDVTAFLLPVVPVTMAAHGLYAAALGKRDAETRFETFDAALDFIDGLSMQELAALRSALVAAFQASFPETKDDVVVGEGAEGKGGEPETAKQAA